MQFGLVLSLTICCLCGIVSVEELLRVGSGNISIFWITCQILWGTMTAIFEMNAFYLTLKIYFRLPESSPARPTLFWLCYANLFMSIACILQVFQTVTRVLAFDYYAGLFGGGSSLAYGKIFLSRRVELEKTRSALDKTLNKSGARSTNKLQSGAASSISNLNAESSSNLRLETARL
jgi:hypothetical protein